MQNHRFSPRKTVLRLLVLVGLPTWIASAAVEETFTVLQTRTTCYTNVTVTSKAKGYIYILHSAGMTSIKTSDLTTNILAQLGYKAAEEPKQANFSAWANKALPSVKVGELQWMQQLLKSKPEVKLHSSLVIAVISIAALSYLFFSYCALLICRKAGKEPGILVFIPVLQLIPLLQAAGMSAGWFVAYLIPLLNVVAHLVWCFKIAQARGKTALTGVCLLLPGLNLLAFLYLAFSGGTADSGVSKPNLVSLQTA